jgi:Arc/MetJ family transcription regulator
VTVVIDKVLLDRAKRALGTTTMRATVEEALRRAVDQAESNLEPRRPVNSRTWRRFRNTLILKCSSQTRCGGEEQVGAKAPRKASKSPERFENMVIRTTIELDEELLAEAKRELGMPTTRATVEEALRVATEVSKREREDRRARQREYFRALREHADLDVLKSEEMWR